MPASGFRRSRLLIDSDVQVRLSVRLALCLLGYLVLFCLISLSEPLLVLLGVLSSDMSPEAARQTIFGFSSTILAPLLFAVACMVLHGVLILHRLAGPVFRVRKALTALNNRDMTDRIHLRDRDYLLSLAETYNLSAEGIRQDLVEIRAELDGALGDSLNDGVRERLERATEVLDRYRLRENDQDPGRGREQDPVAPIEVEVPEPARE